MSVKFKTVKNEFPSVEKSLKNLDGKKVVAGCLEGEHAWLAAIHEYGCRINVTPEMRAFLHHKGFHLKADTKVIVIPERSFIRAGHDKNIKKILKNGDILLADVAAGTMSEEQLLKTLGIELSSAIKDYARDLKDPPNHSFTKEQKNSSNPLIDTGDMIGGITYKVE